jgi:polysaccharide deacetylase 2 family uncharacterized protein YibQ
MTADDLSTPLGQQPAKRRVRLPVSLPQVMAGGLALFLGVFVAWAIVGDNPFGGEPMVAVPIDGHPAAVNKSSASAATEAAAAGAQRYDGPAVSPSAPAGAAAGTKTVTIIDGKTGARQQVVIPDSGNGPDPASGLSADQRFVELTPQGPIPKIAADGMRPAQAFAQPVRSIPGKPDAARVALVVSGLGVSASLTSEAIAKMPGAVTLAFMPYGSDLPRLVARARSEGHEILLQVPMEPFGYPDNDSGPQTLLTSLTAEQNLARLHWLMARFQGYVGLADAVGARFTASEESLAPILREAAKRGLIFLDDGSSPRSLAGRIAAASNLPFAKADITVDSVPTPTEIDNALGRLETLAREHGVAVGMASALPVSIEHVSKWAKGAESRGLLLVPITAVATGAKPS